MNILLYILYSQEAATAQHTTSTTYTLQAKIIRWAYRNWLTADKGIQFVIPNFTFYHFRTSIYQCIVLDSLLSLEPPTCTISVSLTGEMISVSFQQITKQTFHGIASQSY